MYNITRGRPGRQNPNARKACHNGDVKSRPALVKIMYYIKLLRMGFTLHEAQILKKKVNKMTIDEILKLGEMGYSKEEISNLEEKPNVDLNKQIDALEGQIKSLKDALQISNTRETVTENSGENTENSVEDALNILAGNGSGESGNNK